MNVALVGGGKAAVVLLEFFAALKNVNVVGISDPREDAPGILRARSLGIFTTKRTEQLLGRQDANIIVELTGNAKVRAELAASLRADQETLFASCARLMCDVIEAQASRNAEAAATISEKFKVSADQISRAIEKIDLAFADVEKLLREAGLVTLNAKIECARAGDAGMAFAIVVNRLHEMLGSIRDAMDKISAASTEGQGTLANLKLAEEQLAEVFHSQSTNRTNKIL